MIKMNNVEIFEMLSVIQHRLNDEHDISKMTEDEIKMKLIQYLKEV
jgi:hypothetical protein